MQTNRHHSEKISRSARAGVSKNIDWVEIVKATSFHVFLNIETTE